MRGCANAVLVISIVVANDAEFKLPSAVANVSNVNVVFSHLVNDPVASDNQLSESLERSIHRWTHAREVSEQFHLGEDPLSDWVWNRVEIGDCEPGPEEPSHA